MKEKTRKSKKVLALKNEDSVLRSYLREITRIPLLTRDEEDEIARKAAKGDKSAQDKLVNANLRFVVRVAKKYQGRGLPLPDLISEGNIGLLKAVEHFDVDRGFHFISYAVWWIRQAIMMAISEKGRVIRMPLYWNNKYIQIERVQHMLQESHNSNLKTEDVARFMDMDIDKIEELIMFAQDAVSLEHPISNNENSPTIGDFLENENQISPVDHAVNISLKGEIEEALKSLDKREADIIRARYGIGDNGPMSLEEIGDLYHMSKEGVRQIENKAIQHLRHPARRHKLESYVA